MEKREINSSNGFSPVYKEISDIIGPQKTYEIYQQLGGQQLSLPKRLYTTEYIVNKAMQASDDNEIRRIAKEFFYTEKYLRQLLKQRRGEINDFKN